MANNMKKFLFILLICFGVFLTTNCTSDPNAYSERNNISWHETLGFSDLDELSIYPFESKYDFAYNYYLNKKFLKKYGFYTNLTNSFASSQCYPFEYLSFPKIIDNEAENNLLKEKAFFNVLTAKVIIGTWRMSGSHIVPLIYDQSEKLKNNKNVLKDYFLSKATLIESLKIGGIIKINYQIIGVALAIPQYAYIKNIIIEENDVIEVENEMLKADNYEEYKIKIFLPREEGKYLINQISFYIETNQYDNVPDYELFSELKKYIPYFDEYVSCFMLDKEIITVTNSKIYNCDFRIGSHN